MESLPPISKTSGRYRGIYPSTGLGSGGTSLAHDTAEIAVQRAHPSGRWTCNATPECSTLKTTPVFGAPRLFELGGKKLPGE
jgi:hypothetical protein